MSRSNEGWDVDEAPLTALPPFLPSCAMSERPCDHRRRHLPFPVSPPLSPPKLSDAPDRPTDGPSLPPPCKCHSYGAQPLQLRCCEREGRETSAAAACSPRRGRSSVPLSIDATAVLTFPLPKLTRIPRVMFMFISSTRPVAVCSMDGECTELAVTLRWRLWSQKGWFIVDFHCFLQFKFLTDVRRSYL